MSNDERMVDPDAAWLNDLALYRGQDRAERQVLQEFIDNDDVVGFTLERERQLLQRRLDSAYSALQRALCDVMDCEASIASLKSDISALEEALAAKALRQ
ncbi:hypothetical protein [Mycobacterium syngnathidarum]